MNKTGNNVFNKLFLQIITIAIVCFTLFSSTAIAGSINGTVTATDGGAAIQEFYVKAQNYATNLDYSDKTAADGSYNITDIPSGSYRIYVQTIGTNYIQEYYNNTYYEEEATPVSIDTGSVVTIDFSLEEGMKITGLLQEDFGGSPIEGVMLVAYDYATNEWMRWAHSNASGNYQIQGLPAGSYRVMAGGNGYAVENYDNTYYPSQATPVVVTQGSDTTGIDFNLAQGGTITGTVFKNDGTTPVTDTVIEIEILSDDPCGDYEWLLNTGTDKADGTYEIQGIPPIDVCVRADENDGGYTTEWWAQTGSSWECSDAETLTISAGSTNSNINFQLDTGGSVNGVVKNNSGNTLSNIKVDYGNGYLGVYKTVFTDSNGSFNFSGLPPGPTRISIKPETQLGLVHHKQKYWLEQGQDMDIGTTRLEKGALVTGFVQDQASAGLGHIDLDLEKDYPINWGGTQADGSYVFRVPKGYSTINMDEDGYHMMPERLHINSVNQTINRGTSTAYNNATCSTVSGTVTDSAAHNGQLVVAAFPDGIQYREKEWKGVAPISYAVPSSGSYILYVPPGRNVTILCILMSEDNYDQESATVVGTVTGVSPSASGINFSYTSEGTTVQGYIKDRTGYCFNANASIFKPDAGSDDFAGFAETDKNGKFEFYNVQPGTYQIDAVYYNNMYGQSTTFTVGANPVTLPDITVRSMKTIIPLLDLLLLND